MSIENAFNDSLHMKKLVKNNVVENYSEAEEKINHEKAKLLSKLNLGAAQVADLVLVATGNKPATELDIYPWNDSPEFILKELDKLNLSYIYKGEIVRGKNKVQKYAVAYREDTLARLAQASASKNHEEFGRLMGYPETAIDAFLHKDKLLPEEEYPDMRDIVMPMKLSRDNWQEEYKHLKKQSKLVKKYSPEIYDTLIGK